MAAYYPLIEPGLYFCAGSIAVSRVLLGMHFLSDVLAGILIGMSDQRAGLGLRRVDPRVRRAHIDAFGVGLDPGTQARHCELYRR